MYGAANGAGPTARTGGPLFPAAGTLGSDPMAAMQFAWQAEMLRTMRKLARGRDGDSDDSDDQDPLGFVSTKAFKGVQRLRRRFARRPERLLQEFVTRTQIDLGICHPSQYWTMMDHSRKIRSQFKQMHGLYRCHVGAAEALQHWLEGRPQHMATYICLLMQAIHQTALDGGSWDNAVLFLPSPDPLGHAEFGGSPGMMTDVAAYRRGMKDLKKKHGGGDERAETTETAEDKPGRRTRGGKPK